MSIYQSEIYPAVSQQGQNTNADVIAQTVFKRLCSRLKRISYQGEHLVLNVYAAVYTQQTVGIPQEPATQPRRCRGGSMTEIKTRLRYEKIMLRLTAKGIKKPMK